MEASEIFKNLRELETDKKREAGHYSGLFNENNFKSLII